MKTRMLFFINLLALSFICQGNNIQLSNVTIVNNGPGNIQVQFDLSWDNSWRINVGPANYDGAWVFFKYKTATGNWTHVTMTGSNNVIPTGFEMYQTTAKTGTIIHRAGSNLGTGNFALTGIRLGIMNNLPYDIDVKGFALEMVYIPSPGYRTFFGDGNGTSESQNAFHYVDNTATWNGVLPTKVDANFYDDADLDNYGIYVFTNDTIQKSNPIGPLDPFPTMKALWCMKYEISQAAYRDFLNTLTVTQQTARTTAAPTSAVGTRVLPPSTTMARNYIKIRIPASGSVPAVYGCDASGNNIFDEAADGEWLACNFLNWPDVAAFLDWSGLAPMSELQYERICRGYSSAGSQPAVYGEFAWGTNSIYSTNYSLSSAGTSGEVITNSTGLSGNAVYNLTDPSLPESGVLRSGIFATPTSDRISSGASYYGVLEMTGNVGEYCITLGTVAGRSCYFVPNGNGSISANGDAQLTVGGSGFWPGMEGNVTSGTANTCAGNCEVTGNAGIMLRGGHWLSSPASVLAVSYRSSALPVITPRYEGYGGRGVLYIR